METVRLEELGLNKKDAKVIESYIEYHSKGRQELYLYRFEELIIVSQFSWWTRIEGGGYCTPRTVTDDACRRVSIFNIEKNMHHTGHAFDSNLFRTTKQGVVGRKYDVNISSATRDDTSLLVTFADGESRKITLKEN